MINKIIIYLIIILFFSIAIVNSHLLDIFGLENISSYFYINWNYEFFKVLFFNIISSTIIFLFFVKNILKKNYIYLPKIIYIVILTIIISNIFSISPLTSLLWNNEKWHGTLMFINLIWLFIILINLLRENKSLKKKLLNTLILSSFVVSIIWTKEFLYPSFDYWDLSNRALSSFGHPNYLSLYLLLIIPIINNFLNKNKDNFLKYIYSIVLIFIVITLFLTKSIWAIFLFFSYIIYLKYEKIKKIIWKKSLFGLYILFITLWVILVLKYYPEKLSSFISRFYIWESTLNIIFSDTKVFLIWNWLWNLDLVFEWFKNINLYIFENYWFIADRPHNIFLYVFYSFGIIWLLLFLYILKIFYKKLKGKHDKLSSEIIILFIAFNFLNFSSIASYLVIILSVGIFYNSIIIKLPYYKGKYHTILIKIFFIITSLFSIYFYTNYFLEEHKYYNNKLYQTNNYLLKKIKLENREENIFKYNNDDPKKLCKALIQYSKSVENYIYCWNILYLENKSLAISYYKLWINKLPDLWNDNSLYYNNIFINKKDLKHRFFSEKYSNIKQVLERVWIKKEFDL